MNIHINQLFFGTSSSPQPYQGYSAIQRGNQQNSAPTNQEQSGTITRNNKEISGTEKINDDAYSASENLSETNNKDLSTYELHKVTKLKKRDAEVKAHELAHLATAGSYAAGGMQFTYQQGPDGKRYAVGGEVPIDMSKENTPEKTIQKMDIVARAALAPATPSSADRRIAARAAVIEAEARREMEVEQQKNVQNDTIGAEKKVESQPEDADTEATFSPSPNRRTLAINAYRKSAF